MKDEKILQEEILDDEKLEKVSGGSSAECWQDERLLMQFGIMDKGEHGCIRRGWKRLGIELKQYNHDHANIYFKLGTDREISRKEALSHAMRSHGWNQVVIDCFDWEEYGL